VLVSSSWAANNADTVVTPVGRHAVSIPQLGEGVGEERPQSRLALFRPQRTHKTAKSQVAAACDRALGSDEASTTDVVTPSALRSVPFRLDAEVRAANERDVLAAARSLLSRRRDRGNGARIQGYAGRSNAKARVISIAACSLRCATGARHCGLSGPPATPSSASSTTPQRNKIDLIARRCDGLACRRLCGCRRSRCPLRKDQRTRAGAPHDRRARMPRPASGGSGRARPRY